MEPLDLVKIAFILVAANFVALPVIWVFSRLSGPPYEAKRNMRVFWIVYGATFGVMHLSCFGGL